MKAEAILRQKAEAILKESPSKTFSQLSETDIQKLIHELEVYQIELEITSDELQLRNKEKAQQAAKLIIANKELAYQNQEKEKRAAELIIANQELLYDKNEKEKRAAELIILNSKLDLMTELVKANKLIALQHDQLKHIASLLPGVIYQYRLRPDGTSCFPYVSEAFKRIFRINPEDVLEDAAKVWNIIHPDDLDKVSASALLSAKNLTPWQQEYRLKFDDGTVRTIYSNSAPLAETDGSVLSYGYAVDSTEHKLRELQIAQKNEELQKNIAEKDKFFSIIAHDLRGSFSGFLGLTEMLAEKSNGMSKDTTQQIAVLMKDSATSLFQLLGNLLEWSKTQRGLTAFEPVSSILMNKIIEILPLAAAAAEKKNIAIRYQIDNDLTIFADSNMLAAIFRNLVTNAIKFTPKGGTVTISAKSDSDEWVEIAVNDTGIGMSEKTIDALFTLEINTNRKGTNGELSSGLGLLICKDFIEKHNGILSITSEVNKGSTFSFTLPGKPKDLTIN